MFRSWPRTPKEDPIQNELFKRAMQALQEPQLSDSFNTAVIAGLNGAEHEQIGRRARLMPAACGMIASFTLSLAVLAISNRLDLNQSAPTGAVAVYGSEQNRISVSADLERMVDTADLSSASFRHITRLRETPEIQSPPVRPLSAPSGKHSSITNGDSMRGQV